MSVENKGIITLKTENVSDNGDSNFTTEQDKVNTLIENNDKFKSLSINRTTEKLVNTISKKRNDLKRKFNFDKTSTPLSCRRSRRIANLPISETDIPINNVDLKTNQDEQYNQVSISVPKEEYSFYEKLNSDKSVNEAVVDDVHTFSIDKVIKSEHISTPEKVDMVIFSNDENEDMTYEQLREKNIKENLEILQSFGINHTTEKLVNTLSKKRNDLKRKYDYDKTSTPLSCRRSRRIANLPISETDILNNFDIKPNQDEQYIPKYNQISISVPKEEYSFYEKLNSDISVNEAVVDDVHTFSIDNYTTVLKSLKMHESPLKVIESRIYSLAIHPSETSLIIAAGDMKGNISFYNKNDSINSKKACCVHDGPVNCMSFCSWDPYKLFSTSHDGSVRCGDIVNHTFDMIYNTNLWDDNTVASNKLTHITWHTEYERNLLIGSGAGRVDLVDIRTPNKIQNTAWCHERSVRTVQCHPLENHYFLTASGIGEIALWDIRNITQKSFNPVLKFEHPKALKSAFFSATGINMISTSNDDYIRIFNTSQLNETAIRPVKNIPHNNRTGRWLSVIKAKWTPGRDDIFFTGSLISPPKRMEIYRSDGTLLHNLIDEVHMNTYCTVIEAHPTQAIYVGGNASGRIHIYST